MSNLIHWIPTICKNEKVLTKRPKQFFKYTQDNRYLWGSQEEGSNSKWDRPSGPGSEPYVHPPGNLQMVYSSICFALAVFHRYCFKIPIISIWACGLRCLRPSTQTQTVPTVLLRMALCVLLQQMVRMAEGNNGPATQDFHISTYLLRKPYRASYDLFIFF